MTNLMKSTLFCALVCAMFPAAQSASAHGIVGNRFFPPTLSTDDPFAVDELALPSFFYVKNAGDPADHQLDYGFEFDKEIFPHFALGVSDAFSTINPDVGKFAKGFGNLTLTAKYEVYQDAKSEFIFSVGIEVDLGGIGTKGFRDSFTTYTPTLYFGKGFGDLPDKLAMLQPFAVTAELGQSFPTSADEPNAFGWGFAVEYSLMYLQQHVKDTGLPAPFKDMIPLVEFSMTTTENRGGRGLTTGTINPGVLWVTKSFELGVEAAIPVNHESGAHVGVTATLWIFIDDLFPQTFGHPVFGARE